MRLIIVRRKRLDWALGIVALAIFSLGVIRVSRFNRP